MSLAYNLQAFLFLKFTRLFGFSFPFDFHLLSCSHSLLIRNLQIKSAQKRRAEEKLVRNKTCSNKIASWTQINNSKESPNFYVSRLLLPLPSHLLYAGFVVATCMPTLKPIEMWEEMKWKIRVKASESVCMAKSTFHLF